MSASTPTNSKNSKLRMVLLVIAGILLVAFALFLSVGVGGQFLQKFAEQRYIKTTHGLAVAENEIDPHIIKIQTEYGELIKIADKHNLDGIYELISAGDFAYESLKPDEVGQYTIQTTIIFPDAEVTKTAFNEMVEQLKAQGYEIDEETPATEELIQLKRMILAVDEGSKTAPGNDTIVISYNPQKDKGRLTFFYQGTTAPLSVIPAGDKNYTVTELEDLQQQIIEGKVDICEFEPNGAVGGWYPEYSCQKDYL